MRFHFCPEVRLPSLNWLGKDAVLNHHLDVPYKTLELKDSFNCEKGSSENKIIHGDNLEALKALMPEYEGKVKCIYIDPPYNTGNENWVYNDNVNSPKIRKWLGQVVGKEAEDLTRHDKWLCMMYPRLKLLHKLLREDGFIAVSIDDCELVNLLCILDDIFGYSNKIACIPVLSEPSGGKSKEALRIGHEYILLYFKASKSGLKYEMKNVEGSVERDEFGEYIRGRELSKWGDESLRSDRPEMWFPIKAPDGTDVFPYRNDGKEGRWRWGKNNPNMQELIKNPQNAHWEKRKFDNGVFVNGKRERWFPYEKIRTKEKYFGWKTWLDTIGFNSEGTKELKNIFGEKIFSTPKPTSLVQWIVNLMADNDGIILDSFAGSGTTAHAVLNLNKQDGGNRKFILVEMEDYADNITAERVRRVIKGYGTGKNIVEGTGGDFNYYELGPEMLLDGSLNEEQPLENIRNYIYYTETNSVINAADVAKNGNEFFLGNHDNAAYYLFYKKTEVTTLDVEFLGTISQKAERYVIYADNCVLPKDFLFKNNIVFKKIPRDVRRF